MSELQTTGQNKVQVQPNPFEEIGRGAQRPIAGQLMKFSKGEYVAGQENLPLPMGMRFVVNMDQMLTGWIRWDDNKPAEQVMGLVVEGFVPPKRDTLGYGYKPGDKEEDADTTDWEVDEKSGNPRDPWQPTFYLVMRGLDKDDKPLEDELYTFTTASKGGSDAVKAFCAVYGKWLRFHPDDHPIITIGYDQYEHSNPQYGWIKTPQFITGYTSPEQVRQKKKVKLFDPNKDWMPKKQFGDIPLNEQQQDEIPF